MNVSNEIDKHCELEADIKTDNELTIRTEACIILSAVGDAVGFHSGRWEFCYDYKKILQVRHFDDGCHYVTI